MTRQKVYCNLCGKEFDEFDQQASFHISQRLGYGSVHDGDTLELDICCECMDKLIDGCELSPIE